MKTIAVVAHAGKTVGGGLPELRRVLEQEGIVQPLWFEVAKSRYAPKQVKRALAKGADIIIAWGGDGMMQQCIDTLTGSKRKATLVIVPAGTANLLAGNLGIPQDIAEAVRIGLHGDRRKLDVGRLNGEHFAVMAGAGVDARMIDAADGSLKDRLGRLAYVLTGATALRAKPFTACIEVDGAPWYKGTASCVLIGNVGNLFGGIQAFEGAKPDDGLLELGVVTADGPVEWTRTLVRTVAGTATDSPFVRTTKARSLTIRFDRPVPYELDGGARTKVKELRIKVKPKAVTVAVPMPDDSAAVAESAAVPGTVPAPAPALAPAPAPAIENGTAPHEHPFHELPSRELPVVEAPLQRAGDASAAAGDAGELDEPVAERVAPTQAV